MTEICNFPGFPKQIQYFSRPASNFLKSMHFQALEELYSYCKTCVLAYPLHKTSSNEWINEHFRIFYNPMVMVSFLWHGLTHIADRGGGSSFLIYQEHSVQAYALIMLECHWKTKYIQTLYFYLLAREGTLWLHMQSGPSAHPLSLIGPSF